MIKYYIDDQGNYLGGFEGSAPDGGIEVSSARPSENHSWVIDQWVLQYSEELLKQYRDTYIEQDITVGDITVTNMQDTRTSLSAILQSWMTDKTISTIKFKHNDGIEDAGFDDLQAVLKACFAREQVGRSAEAVVLSNHANTPYTTMQDAYDDFDEEV